MATAQKPGLRDRKRIETRARLEDAAVTLVLRDGLDATTVEAISALADVSPRTFFNYFDSKDAAVLGLRDLELATDEPADLSEDPVESVLRLLFQVMTPPGSRTTIREDRIEIIRRNPSLMTTHVDRMMQVAGELGTAIASTLEQYPRFASETPEKLAATSELLLALCVSAIRVTIREWAAAGAPDNGDELRRAAFALVTDTVEKIS